MPPRKPPAKPAAGKGKPFGGKQAVPFGKKPAAGTPPSAKGKTGKPGSKPEGKGS